MQMWSTYIGLLYVKVIGIVILWHHRFPLYWDVCQQLLEWDILNNRAEVTDARTSYQNYMADQKYSKAKQDSFINYIQNVI